MGNGQHTRTSHPVHPYGSGEHDKKRKTNGNHNLTRIDEQIAGALKARARKEDASDNTVMLRILKESLGLEKKKRSVLYDDLDHLAGTWSDQDTAEFERATAAFEAVDTDMWHRGPPN